MLTVGELIEALRRFPPGLRVVVDGYEDGFDDAAAPAEIKLSLNVNDKWYLGPHEKHESGTPAVFIGAAEVSKGKAG